MDSSFAQKAGQKLDLVLGLIAGVILMIMMLLTTCDVVARYALNAPIRGAFELTEVSLVLLIYAGLPLVSRREAHVVVDLFEAWMSVTVKQVLRVLGNVLCMAALGGMAWLIYLRAVRVASYGDTTSVLKMPLAPVAFTIAALILVTGLVHIGLIFTKPPEEEATSAL
jgi:TRAP-type C4-dicarboxylate transport system permease small subunit